MKLNKYISALSLSVLLFSACDSDLDKVSIDTEEATPAVIESLLPSYELTPENAGKEIFTVKWAKPNYGYSAAITNNIEIDLAGKNFANASILASSKGGNEYTFKVADVNNKLLGLLKAYEMDIPEVSLDFELRITSSISNAVEPLNSNVVTTKMLPYPTERDYPKLWVVGDYCGWSHEASQFLYSFKENEEYQGVVDFGEKASNGFKFTGVAGWDPNWGIDGDSGVEPETLNLSLGGGDIKCYFNRFYRFSFNTSTLVLKKDFSFNVISVVGDAGSQVNGWGAAEVDMQFDNVKQRFWVDVELSDGEIKFRTNNSWDVLNFGGSEGILSTSNDAPNIQVVAGEYRIYVSLNDENNMTYELNTTDYGL